MTVVALDPTNTARAFIDYDVSGHRHTLMVRCLEDATDAELSSEIGPVLTAFTPLVFLSTLLAFRRAAKGSNVTVPAVWTGPATWGAGAGDDTVVPWMWSITGRDLTGHKVRWDWFGRRVAANGDYRLQANDDTTIEAVIAAIDATEGSFVTINERTPLINPYANETVSGYWQRQLRK
jgi:hypothetical protein